MASKPTLIPAGTVPTNPACAGPSTAAANHAAPTSRVAPLPAMQCPLCGGPNQCAPACSGSFDTPCWCANLRVSPAALARLAPSQRGTACLCPSCAADSEGARSKTGQPRG